MASEKKAHSISQKMESLSLAKEDDVSLEEIAQAVIEHLSKTSQKDDEASELVKKYNIQEKDDCWPLKDIKRVWRDLQKKNPKKAPSTELMIQMMKKSLVLHLWYNLEENETDDDDVSVKYEVKSDIGGGDFSGETIVHSKRYFQIPLSEMSISERVSPEAAPRSQYRLINGTPSHQEKRRRKSYVATYNSNTKNCDWVYEILNKNTLTNEYMSVNFGTSQLTDSNYERGRMAAAANHTSCQEAYNDTFFFSNFAPQLCEMNRGPWKRLENYCREKTNPEKNVQNVQNVHVYTGPLYLNKQEQRLGEKMVPSHFFKVLIVENTDGTVEEPECYKMPNLTNPDLSLQSDLQEYRVETEDIERESGLTFLVESPGNTQYEEVTLEWGGEGKNGELCSVQSFVRINM